jgi:hypothetical protein
LKIAIATLLPSQQAQTLLSLAKSRAGNWQKSKTSKGSSS